MSILEIVLLVALIAALGALIFACRRAGSNFDRAQSLESDRDFQSELYDCARRDLNDTLEFYRDKRTVTTEQWQKLKVIEALEKLDDAEINGWYAKQVASTHGLTKKEVKKLSRDTGLSIDKLYELIPCGYKRRES